MTAIFSNSSLFANKFNNKRSEYQVEVVTFDGESVTVYVTASSASEAAEIAASSVDNADYTMVYKC
ncbi:MAG: hypothetical protein HUK11_10345 [Muribaculaceae bacterium]|nr:hypothetical protein [Muribaculaceae bacterium]